MVYGCVYLNPFSSTANTCSTVTITGYVYLNNSACLNTHWATCRDYNFSIAPSIPGSTFALTGNAQYFTINISSAVSGTINYTLNVSNYADVSFPAGTDSSGISFGVTFVNSTLTPIGSISGLSSVCQGQNVVTYTIPSVNNATSYTWTLPTGATGTSSANSIDVDYSSTAISGNITVKANYNCGSSDVSVLPITVSSLPLQAGQITGSSIVCQGQNDVTYIVPPITNAASYIWTIPSIGVQTTATNTITVSFPETANSGNISVQGNNDCGVGLMSVLPITLNAKPIVTNGFSVLHSNISFGNQWYNTDGIINGATAQNYEPTAIGNYYVVVNGCASNSVYYDGTTTGSTCMSIISGGNTIVNSIKSDNTLWTWGNGQTYPIKIGDNSDWLSVSTGLNHSLAIKIDGTIWSWGNNSYGQLGDGTTINKPNPVQVGSESSWLYVFAINNRSYGIKLDGTLWGWGKNSSASIPVFGLLGDGTSIDRYTPVQIGSSNNWKFISGNNIQTMALKTNGTIWGWGKAILGEGSTGLTSPIETPVQIGTSNDWNAIATMFNNTIAIKTDGSLWGWGSNTNYQLGSYNHAGPYYYPEQISLDYDWSYISGGYGHSVAIKTDGSLWSWGFNDNGQIGDGTMTDRQFPYHIGNNTNWSSVTCTYFSSIALNSSGIHYGWGQNTNGQIGNDTNVNSFYPLVGISCTGLLSNEDFGHTSEIKIYPNPVKNDFTISTLEIIKNIEIFDAIGKRVFYQNHSSNKINIDFLSKGMYIVKINTENQTFNSKIIKE